MEIDATGMFRSIYEIKVVAQGIVESGIPLYPELPIKVALAFQDDQSIQGSPAKCTPAAVSPPQGHVLHIHMAAAEAKALLRALQMQLSDNL